MSPARSTSPRRRSRSRRSSWRRWASGSRTRRKLPRKSSPPSAARYRKTRESDASAPISSSTSTPWTGWRTSRTISFPRTIRSRQRRRRRRTGRRRSRPSATRRRRRRRRRPSEQTSRPTRGESSPRAMPPRLRLGRTTPRSRRRWSGASQAAGSTPPRFSGRLRRCTTFTWEPRTWARFCIPTFDLPNRLGCWKWAQGTRPCSYCRRFVTTPRSWTRTGSYAARVYASAGMFRGASTTSSSGESWKAVTGAIRSRRRRLRVDHGANRGCPGRAASTAGASTTRG